MIMLSFFSEHLSEMFSSSLNISQTPVSLSCEAVGNHSPTGGLICAEMGISICDSINKEECDNTRKS